MILPGLTLPATFGYLFRYQAILLLILSAPEMTKLSIYYFLDDPSDF